MATAPTKNGSRTELITNAIDKKAAGNLIINRESGGMRFENMAEVMEFAKLMAVSGHAVPPHCRNNPGLCLGLAIQAVEWRMSPFAVAGKSYVVNDRIGYESQLVHAVIEQRAPITARLRHEFIGEGPKRRCRVWAAAKGEAEPLVYTSPEISKINPQNSPLWKTKPDLQLYYNTSRDWARAYFPDVILGVYSEDELIDSPAMAHHQERPKGVAGLKTQLVAHEVEVEDESEPFDDTLEDADGADQEVDDAIEAPPSSTITPEEEAEMEREARSQKSMLQDDGSDYYGSGH